jgi:DNA repair protein RecO (recombination protein O)
MYHLYHTPALVVGSSPRGEGSKVFSLFTRELGLLRVTATSVREERSKLRYGLQDFAYSEVTLVRGKEFWRLARAEPRFSVATELRGHVAALCMFGRVFKLLERLLAGEEKNEQLFTAVLESMRFMSGVAGVQRVESVEVVLVLRILYLLGYLAPREEFGLFLQDFTRWDNTVMGEALLYKSLALSHINESLKHSQL